MIDFGTILVFAAAVGVGLALGEAYLARRARRRIQLRRNRTEQP